MHPDFNLFAQALVNQLILPVEKVKLTDIQKVNRALLKNRFLSPMDSDVWMKLLENKVQIAGQWSELDRFDLECGNNYALLLDRNRKTSQAKPTIVAIAVAHAIHTGIKENELMDTIKSVSESIFPDSSISPNLVKQALMDFSLVSFYNDFVIPTPIVKRFAVETQSLEEHK